LNVGGPIEVDGSGAEEALRAKDWHKALAVYEWLIHSGKDARRGHAGKCELLRKLDRKVEALSAAEEFRRNFPKDTGAHLERARCLVALHRPEDAVTAYRGAIELEPGHSDAWRELGMVQGRLGELEEAFRCYERAAGRFSEERPTVPPEKRSRELERAFHELMAGLGESAGGIAALTAPQLFAFKASLATLMLLLGTYDMDGVVVAMSKPCDIYRKAIKTRINTKHPPHYVDLSAASGTAPAASAAEDVTHLSMFEPDRIDSAIRNGLQKVTERYGGEEHFVLFDDLSAMEYYCSTETVKKFAASFLREMSELRMYSFVIVPDERATRLFGMFTFGGVRRLAYKSEWLSLV
jgi:hypothetical protein